MNEIERQQLNMLLEWKKSLENSQTIPLPIDQSFRKRFSAPIIVQRTLNFPDTAVQTTSELTVEIRGATPGDLVVITPPSAGVVDIGSYLAYVSSTGVVTIRFINPDTVSSWNPGGGVFTIGIFKQ